METLGVSIAGGVASHRGDTPVYITNINPDGCVGRTNVLKVIMVFFYNVVLRKH